VVGIGTYYPWIWGHYCVCVCARACVCVHVCVRARVQERERETFSCINIRHKIIKHYLFGGVCMLPETLDVG
jgi:hypothetical protein